MSYVPAHGAEPARWPSLFRGVVVVDSPIGVQVVSVEAGSQASLGDLRPDDVIVRIQDQDIRTIDEFATLSLTLKGRVPSTNMVVFRRGRAQELTLHLYSYPILKTWGIEVIPDYALRFAEAATGLAYWARMGRGFEEAGKPEQALEAYVNALHNDPADVPSALNASRLLWEVGRLRLTGHDLAGGIAALEQAVTMLQRLMEQPLSDEQLQLVKEQLQYTLDALKRSQQGRGPTLELDTRLV